MLGKATETGKLPRNPHLTSAEYWARRKFRYGLRNTPKNQVKIRERRQEYQLRHAKWNDTPEIDGGVGDKNQGDNMDPTNHWQRVGRNDGYRLGQVVPDDWSDTWVDKGHKLLDDGDGVDWVAVDYPPEITEFMRRCEKYKDFHRGYYLRGWYEGLLVGVYKRARAEVDAGSGKTGTSEGRN